MRNNDKNVLVANDLFQTAQNDINIIANNNLNLTGSAGFAGYSGGDMKLTATGVNHQNSGGDLRLTSGGTSNISSSGHYETANVIHMNGPPAAIATSAEPSPEAIEATEAIEALKAKFMIRIPQHEPWAGHENWNPPEVTPDKTEAIETSSQDFHYEDRGAPTDRTPIPTPFV